MEQFISDIAPHMPYAIVLGVIWLSGFGLPLPEDVPIIAAGYLCGTGMADPWIMFPAVFVSIIGADSIVFLIGRRYGHHVPKLPLLRRFLTEPRLAWAERKLHQHGGKFIFVARFLPGMRAPAIFTAGTFKLPAWRFLLYNGSAAALSVPLLLFLSYYFAENIEQVRKWVVEGQLAVIGLIVAIIVAVVVTKLRLRRRMAKAQAQTPPNDGAK